MIILSILLLYILWTNYSIPKNFGFDSIEYKNWIDRRFILLFIIYLVSIIFILEKQFFLFVFLMGILWHVFGALKFEKNSWKFLLIVGPIFFYLTTHPHGSVIGQCVSKGGKLYGTVGDLNTLWTCANFFGIIF